MRHYVKLAALGILLIAPVTTTIAASKSTKLARCDGKHRRPANVYGSILPTVDPASGAVKPASATKGGVDIFPLDGPAQHNLRRSKARPSGRPLLQLPPISAVTPPTSFRSC
jgi:hypothetical protein